MSRRKKMISIEANFARRWQNKEEENLQKSNVNCLEKSGGKDRLPSGSVTTICFFIDVDFFCSDAILFVFISIYGNIPFFVIET